jgi:hypothetical protein
MPFKSKAQRRKFAQLLVDGAITPEVYEEWNRETGRAKLPERVKPKTRRRKAKTKRKLKTSRTRRRRTRVRSVTVRKKRSARKRVSRR